MILVLADSTDPWAIVVHRELYRRSSEGLLWVQPAELLDRIKLNWPVVNGAACVPGSLLIDERMTELDDVTGIFTRLSSPLHLPLEDLDAVDRDYVVKEATAAWVALLSALPCTVINRPRPGGRPSLLGTRPWGAALAKKHGFLVTPVHCTSSQADALARLEAWEGRVYFRLLGSSEAGTFLSANDGAEQLSRAMEAHTVSMLPVPDGQRVTMYVVGEEVAATVIHSNAQTTGGAQVSWLPTESCRDLARALGLQFAECRFVVTPEEEVYLLEVSGHPNYWLCPQDVQQQVVAQLADCLSEPRSLPLHDSLDGADGRWSAGERVRETGGQER